MNQRQLVIKRKKRKRVTKMENRIKSIKTNFLRDPLNLTDLIVTVDPEYSLKEEKIDFRDKLTPIKNQYNIGSCSVFAVLAILEMKLEISLSSMFLYYKARTSPKLLGGKSVPSTDIKGVNIRCVLQILQNIGCCSELSWEYKKDLIYTEPTLDICELAQKYKINKFYKIDQKDEDSSVILNKIKIILSKEIPIACAFYMPVSIKSASTAKSGMVDYAWLTNYGHAVTLIGFDNNYKRNGQEGCLIFKNSWGKEWGDNGFGYLPYSFVLYKKCYDLWVIDDDKLHELHT